jgi:hypothetical protein
MPPQIPSLSLTSSNSSSSSSSSLESTDEPVDVLSLMRNGNHSPKTQIQRDVMMVSGAINHPGEDQFSGDILKKLHMLLAFGDFYYKRDKAWHKWDLSIAAALCHGSRVLIEFPSELSEEIMAWLFAGKNSADYKRLAASHSVDALSEVDPVSSTTHKALAERKISAVVAGFVMCQAFLSQRLEPFVPAVITEYIDPHYQHYGIDIALGGVGTTNPISGNEVFNNGEHGHLYLCHAYPQNKGTQGLLVGIEQSAFGKHDQNGGSHSINATHHDQTATAGDNFARAGQVPAAYQGIKNIGPDEYYDSLYVQITAEKFTFIKNQINNLPAEWLTLSSLDSESLSSSIRLTSIEEVEEEEEEKQNSVLSSSMGESLLSNEREQFQAEILHLQEQNRVQALALEAQSQRQVNQEADNQKLVIQLQQELLESGNQNQMLIQQFDQERQQLHNDTMRLQQQHLIQLRELKQAMVTAQTNLNLPVIKPMKIGLLGGIALLTMVCIGLGLALLSCGVGPLAAAMGSGLLFLGGTLGQVIYQKNQTLEQLNLRINTANATVDNLTTQIVVVPVIGEPMNRNLPGVLLGSSSANDLENNSNRLSGPGTR